MTEHPLDRAMWRCFSGPQRHLTLGDDRGRRYVPGGSAILAFPDRHRPDFAAVEALCAPGERLYCESWGGPAPAGWFVHSETPMLLMKWGGGPPPPPPDVPFRALAAADVPAMVDLTTRTAPGPFGPRTPELGDYIGRFEGDRLVAMAGERLQLPGHREISGVCTDPAAQGRGLARALMSELMRRQLARGELPFLHVMLENTRARRLYEAMGFVEHHRLPVRVIGRQLRQL